MEFRALAEDSRKRLDRFLRERLPEHSRARLQQWIREGRVQVNGVARASAHGVHEGDRITAEPAPAAPLRAEPESIPLDILYEDGDVIAIDKPAGMVVHAGAGVHTGTVVNALLGRFGSLSSEAGPLRPGIVHRLDRFTSGVLLAAKNDAAHRSLAAQFSGRTVSKTYLALVHGRVKLDSGRVDQPIARDPARRIRMTGRLAGGRAAATSYRVLERLGAFTYLEVRIETGRTHQIRVHLSGLGHPVAGDRLYGAPRETGGLARPARFFLHAHRIEFAQPVTGARIAVTSPLPPELAEWKARAASIMEV